MTFRKKKSGKDGLPPQAQLKKRLIRPGQKVDLILETDLEREVIDVRPSVIQDLDRKGRVIMDQTFPRISQAKVGQMIEVTFLTKQPLGGQERWMRLGYRTPVLEMVEDYQLGPNLRDSVVVVDAPAELSRFTLRLHYRLVPPRERDLRLYIWPDRTKLNLVDISASGVKFTHPRIWHFTVGHPMTLAVVSGGQNLILEGRVVRSGEMHSGRFSGSGVTAVQFGFTSQETQRKLTGLIQEMIRHNLAKRSGLLEKKRR